jgi:hypothetical protein
MNHLPIHSLQTLHLPLPWAAPATAVSVTTRMQWPLLTAWRYFVQSNTSHPIYMGMRQGKYYLFLLIGSYGNTYLSLWKWTSNIYVNNCKHTFTIIYHSPAILITMAPRYAPFSSTSCQPNFGPISSPQGRAKLSAPGPQQMDARKIIK